MKIKNLLLTQIAIATFNLPLLTITGQSLFSSATPFAVGINPQSVISADFNNDGKADLAAANYNSNNVSVLLGDGVGGFNTATNFAVGVGPQSIISADFNADGLADLAVVNSNGNNPGWPNTNNVSILLGNGAGSFGIATSFAVGTGPQSIISADFNGDGKADLATANFYSNNISILLGNGIGGFNAAANLTVSGYPCSVSSSDFNGDGNADLAVANRVSDDISIFLGNGSGNFSINGNLSAINCPSVISTDFNGDGKADLAALFESSNKVSVLLGNGAGSFSTATNFAVGDNPFFLISADFNGDSKADLAVTNFEGNNVSVLLGNGNGGFGSANNFAVGIHPHSLTSSDFNGDGKPDLATADYSDNAVSILLNDYLSPSAPICLVTVDSSLTHNVVVWEKSNLDLIAIDSFIVYREITTNNYERIGAVAKDSMSIFDDFEANPAATAFRYKLKNKNSQGVLSQFSEYHNTMYLTHAGADFSWTPYQIENTSIPVAAYKIYRDDNSTGNFQTIGTTTGNQLGFTDVNYASYPNAQYYVEAVMIAGSCQPTRSDFMASRSNVKRIGISGIQQLNTLSAITIFPNPLSNMLNILGINGKTTLRLYNLVGKLVMEEDVENNTTLSTNQLADGIYTLLSENKVGKTYHKVVISH